MMLLTLFVSCKTTNDTIQPNHNVDVVTLQISGTTEAGEDQQLDENQELTIIKFLVRNNMEKDYHFDANSIYLLVKDEKVFCSEIAVPGKILLTSKTLESGAEYYGYLTYVMSVFSAEYDICFDDGEEQYVVLYQDEKETGKSH